MFPVSIKNDIIQFVNEEDKNIKYVRDKDEYEVYGWVYWNRNRPVLYESEVPNTEKIIFVFKRMSHGLWSFVEKNILDTHIGFNEKDVEITYNFSRMRAFIVKWVLKGWNLDIDLERKENGELTESCFNKVMNIHPRIMAYFIEKMENFLFINEKERADITKQASLLFMPNSPGVVNANEAISMYCTLTSFWEKFGLNYFDLEKLPHDVYMKLRMVLSCETDFRSQQIKSSKKKGNITYGANRRKGVTKGIGK